MILQSRSIRIVKTAKLLCHNCYFDVDHRTDNKFVFCTKNPTHKQQQRNSVEFRLKGKYYYWGLRDLGANQQYINARVNDLGYHSQNSVPVLKNNFKFDGLKAISEKAKEISSRSVSQPEKVQDTDK